MRFLRYVIAALQKTSPGSGEAARALLQSTRLPVPESVLTLLINELCAPSGRETATGYPIAGLGTVQLDAGESIGAHVKIAVLGSADTGEYILTPVVYILDEYPAGNPVAIGSGESVTIS